MAKAKLSLKEVQARYNKRTKGKFMRKQTPLGVKCLTSSKNS